jgi:hypothetical protein
MNKIQQLRKLAKLERKSREIRATLKISPANEVLYRAPQSTWWSDNDVVVEAVGQGDARLVIVEGNYPIDYLIKSERIFPSEDEACEAADELTT